MEFDRSKWPIFTCEALFEPPTIGGSSSPGSSDKLSSTHSMVSFPMMMNPERVELPPMGLSVGKVFMSATEPLFQSPSTLQIQNIKISLGSVSRVATAEVDVILQWLEVKEEEVQAILATTPSPVAQSRLLLSLMTYHEETS